MIKWLKNHLLMADGAVFRHFQLVPESVVLTGEGRVVLHNWKGLLLLWARYKKASLPATSTYVSVHNSYRGYYHWLLESVPKLLEAQQNIPDFTLLLPASYTDSFYGDILRLLSITRLERLEPGTIYRVPTLALPYVAENMGNYDATTLREIKTILFRAAGIVVPLMPDKRVYISRRKAARRKVLNEVDVEHLLTRYDIESVCFEDFSFEEQLRLCARTQLLVGMHGAGLSNIIFLPETASVLELRKFDDGNNYFFTELAAVLGHSRRLQYCAADDESRSVQDADLSVDLAQLENNLRELLA